MRCFRSIRCFECDERGAALVEFTLVLPLLLVLGAGLSEFGLMLHQQQVITKSVRDAARYAAREPVVNRICPISGQAEWAGIVADAQNIALSGNLTGSPLLISTWNNISMVTVSETNPPSTGFLSPCGGGTFPVITVTASVPYTGVGFLSFLGLSSFNLTAAHAEMWTGL